MVAAVGPAAAAAAAYRAAQEGGTAPAAAGASFGEVMGRVAQGALDSGHAADAASGSALAGQGGVTDVVLAVSKAELALQTAVAVRDRVVAAYQDVMRMPI
jgi:flagellar hook-basal body complex protein FliE